MRRAWLAVAAVLLGANAAAAECDSDVAGLRRLAGDPAFPLHWTETGMDDGKPLQLVLRDFDGALHLRFDKAGEGLWAEGVGRVCAVAGGLEMRFEPGRLHAGEAAGWLLRQALQAGGRFTFMRDASGGMQVGATGWRGHFIAVPRR